MRRLFGFALLVLISASVVAGQTPSTTRLIPYSGTALDVAGTPLPGSVMLVFELQQGKSKFRYAARPEIAEPLDPDDRRGLEGRNVGEMAAVARKCWQGCHRPAFELAFFRWMKEKRDGTPIEISRQPPHDCPRASAYDNEGPHPRQCSLPRSRCSLRDVRAIDKFGRHVKGARQREPHVANVAHPLLRVLLQAAA